MVIECNGLPTCEENKRKELNAMTYLLVRKYIFYIKENI